MQLEKWNKLQISWLGQTAVINLPSFLFAFQKLIIKISQSILSKLQMVSTKYIWHYKNASVRLSTLQMLL